LDKRGQQPETAGSEHVLTTDEEAEFTAMIQRQSRFVFRVAYAVLLNAHDAEDAVQETFLKLYRNGGWHGVENERAFLARVTWRVAVDRRPARIAPMSLDEDTGLSEVLEPRSAAPGPEEAAMGANQHAQIHAMIDALPEDLRLPLVLAGVEELNSREIGAVLGIPEGTVRTRLQRARQLLREKLARTVERGRPNHNSPKQETRYA
jgi:RNA polymerase sigma-70 factor (ECF subfamily)